MMSLWSQCGIGRGVLACLRSTCIQKACCRSPQGGVLQTKKDAEIVNWIGRMGAAGAEHVMGRFAMGRIRAYACINRLVANGLLEQRTLLYREPGLYGRYRRSAPAVRA
jgi:hypothetical protein